ncbi:unnamed protein product [Lactuca virosa]|uniref:Uncharacterized protein n=1 Tax=Lactuca virosa TaxID=75947 RepID=A0AAU9LJL0_9ASTR|nr:unnamed protein product [Lactuca virosa]
MTSACIWQVSSESGNESSLPALESSSSSESLATFRAKITANNEAESYARIRSLESRDYYNLLLERKGLLQDRLFDLMFGEQKIYRIMELSPYTNVRAEAYDFLEGKVEPVSSLQHSFQRDIMDGSLNFSIQDINQSGRNSQIYREFYSHFTDEGFRLKFGLPLP